MDGQKSAATNANHTSSIIHGNAREKLMQSHFIKGQKSAATNANYTISYHSLKCMRQNDATYRNPTDNCLKN